MKLLLVGLTVAALPIVLSGCGGDDSNLGSADPGTLAASTIKSTVDQVNQQNSTRLQIESSSSSFSELKNPTDKPRTTRSINATVNCVEGGTASVVGTLVGSNTGTNPVEIALNYTYTVSFDNCATMGQDGNVYTLTSDGVTTSGTSNWTFVNQNPNDGTFGFNGTDSITIAGSINISGTVSVNCDINLSEQLQSTQSGNALTETGSLTGDACGKTYNTTISVNATASGN